MSGFSSIKLGDLSPPLIFEDPSEEAIFADLKARMVAIDPAYEAALSLESSELTIAFQTFAYRLSVHEKDCNEGVLQQMLAFAEGLNLDWQGEVTGGIKRHVIDEGDPDAQPPVAPTMEADKDYRHRIQLAPEGFSTAGPKGAYIYHALRADPRVKDAYCYDGADGQVIVPVLSHEGNGIASADLIAKVTAALSGDFMRPSSDDPQVVAAEIPTYSIDATVYFYAGPDRALAFAEVQKRVREFVINRHRLGDDVSLSGIYAALHIPEVVSRVVLRSPVAEILVDKTQAAYCDPDTAITLIDGGVDD